MRAFAGLCLTLLLTIPPLDAQNTAGQPAGQQAGTAPYTLSVNARIVFLDVTVLDKRNRPVIQGLTQDDFAVFEEHKPQPILSFEAPDNHSFDAAALADEAGGKGAFTEIVLDRLNSTFPEFSFSEIALRRYLVAQPPQLTSPTELMLLDNTSFEMLHSYTRDRDELLEALDHLSAALPLKLNGEFYRERLLQSITALREIAFRNEGLAGRKNVLWLGNGTGLDLGGITAGYEKLKWFSHDTTNALVNGRISLFVMLPGPGVTPISFLDLDKTRLAGLNPDDPFAGNIGIGAFAFETGGTVLHGNFTDRLITEAQTYGTNFYTLTYKPPEGAPDGRFRRVMVKMRDPSLRAVTKIGYYALDNKAPFNARQQEMFHITSEVRSSIPLDALSISLASMVRHTDSGTVEVVLHLASKNLEWQADDQGRSHADLMLSAASLSHGREILASRLQDLPLVVNTQDQARLAATTTNVRMTLHVPRKTEVIRVVLETTEHSRAGSVEISRAAMDAARDAATPAPQLLARPLTAR